MKILLVNDDGFYSEGIGVLDRKLSELGHEVWVCAPESQRSACSHAVSLHNGIQITEKSDKHYTCSGYPADCVLYSVLGAIPMGKPDVVISGINEGFNMSSDLIYSATVGGAVEGALKGIPSIAISCEKVFSSTDGSLFPKERKFVDFPFDDAAAFLAEHLDDFVKNCELGSFININVPDGSAGKWKLTTIGRTEFYDKVVSSEDGLLRIKGAAFPDVFSKDLESTDYYSVFVKKTISVSAFKSKMRYNEAMQAKLSSLA